MKASQETTLAISPMDLENLTGGAVWSDGDDNGYVIALANRNVPKSRRALYPLSVVFTNNFVDVYSIPVETFLKTMKFVEASEETRGYVQSMMLALSAHKEVGAIQEGEISPALVFPQGDEASAPHHVHAQQTQQLMGVQEAAAIDSPVAFLFDDTVSDQTTVAINASLHTLVENPYDNTLEVTLRGINIDLVGQVMEHVVHIDTEDGLYPSNTLQLAGVRRAYVSEPGRGLQPWVVAVFALLTDEDDENEEGAGEDGGRAILPETSDGDETAPFNPNVAPGAETEYDKAMQASITPGVPGQQ